MRFTRLLPAFAAVVALQAAPVPARGDFLTDLLMPESQERSVAESEHPKILAQFGGAYEDKALTAYVQSIVDFLGRTSARPDIKYRITILNTPIVNAFALPAGYLYTTRGLLALANSEAELAGVLAHEIGHVTARHTARRYSRAVVAQGLVGILGAVTAGSNYEGLTKIAEPIAMLALQSYSRDQETEADLLGVKTMSRAGFDPYAMSRFLSSLERKTKLDARLAGADASDSGLDLFATHPRTADRVNRTIAEARMTRVEQPMEAKEIYLGKIDGLLYGDDPKQGFVRGKMFAHPALGFRFAVPDGFSLLNGQSQVLARGPDNAVIQFDIAQVDKRTSPARYLAADWAKDAKLARIETLTIDGREAATVRGLVSTQGGETDIRLVAARGPGRRMYRFLFAAPPAAADAYQKSFLRTARSLRGLTAKERKKLKPFRIRIITTKPSDTAASLAKRLPLDGASEETLRVLNGLATDGEPASGTPLKTIVEG